MDDEQSAGKDYFSRHWSQNGHKRLRNKNDYLRKTISSRYPHTSCLAEPHKKGLTSFNARKPLSNLVGDTGFEPVTSTV
jgi:hypothetical protein